MNISYINFHINRDTAVLELNRPDRGNAFNIGMIREFTARMKEVEKDPGVRFIVIRAQGKHFCLGADLQWMAEASSLTETENMQESLELAGLFETIFFSEKICIAIVSGNCYGGGIGIAAACDRVIAEKNAGFAFGEAKLGLVPSVIAPFVLTRLSYSRARKLMLTGEVLTAVQASHAELVDDVYEEGSQDLLVSDFCDRIRAGSIIAQKEVKKLLNGLTMPGYRKELKEYTAAIIARSRISQEGREGIRAFLDKRKPAWREQ
jgi:methylglutaconyl-CoA hydratase